MSKEIVPVAFCSVINMLNHKREVHYVPSARFIQGILGYEGGDPINRLYSEEDWERYDALIGLHMLTAQFRKSKLPEVGIECRRQVYVKGVEDPKLDLSDDEYRSLKESVMSKKVSPYYESTVCGWFGQSPKQPIQIELSDEPMGDSERAYKEFMSAYPVKDGLLLMEFAMGELSQLFTSIEVGTDQEGTFVRLSDRLTKKKYKLRKEQEFCRSFMSRIEYMEGMAKSTNAVVSIGFDKKRK